MARRRIPPHNLTLPCRESAQPGDALIGGLADTPLRFVSSLRILGEQIACAHNSHPKIAPGLLSLASLASRPWLACRPQAATLRFGSPVLARNGIHSTAFRRDRHRRSVATSTHCRCSKLGMKADNMKRRNNTPLKATLALFTAVLLSACLLGCATSVRPYDDGKVAMIQKGVTTEAQLLDWFGAPRTRALVADGRKTLAWRFSPGKSRLTSSSGRLDVQLDSEGKVSAYSAAAGPK